MNIEPKKVWVVGHKNPDTDSICAAISYAYLKNQLGERQYVPKRAGAISEETRYVLDYFKVEDPELITDVGAQLKDISIRKTAGISSQISLKKAWETMKKTGFTIEEYSKRHHGGYLGERSRELSNQNYIEPARVITITKVNLVKRMSTLVFHPALQEQYLHTSNQL